jgi:hypothetical protein
VPTSAAVEAFVDDDPRLEVWPRDELPGARAAGDGHRRSFSDRPTVAAIAAAGHGERPHYVDNDTNPTGEDAPTTVDNVDPENGARSELKTIVDVRVPTEIAEVVARRAGAAPPTRARSRRQRVGTLVL